MPAIARHSTAGRATESLPAPSSQRHRRSQDCEQTCGAGYRRPGTPQRTSPRSDRPASRLRPEYDAGNHSARRTSCASACPRRTDPNKASRATPKARISCSHAERRSMACSRLRTGDCMLTAYPAMGIGIQQTTAQPASSCTWSTSEHVMRERAGLGRLRR